MLIEIGGIKGTAGIGGVSLGTFLNLDKRRADGPVVYDLCQKQGIRYQYAEFLQHVLVRC